MTLKTYICGTKKQIPRGAISRVAESIGVSYYRAQALIIGAPPKRWEAKCIQDFIHRRACFSPKKCGPPVGMKYANGVRHGECLRRNGARKTHRENGRKKRESKNISLRSAL